MQARSPTVEERVLRDGRRATMRMTLPSATTRTKPPTPPARPAMMRRARAAPQMRRLRTQCSGMQAWASSTGNLVRRLRLRARGRGRSPRWRWTCPTMGTRTTSTQAATAISSGTMPSRSWAACSKTGARSITSCSSSTPSSLRTTALWRTVRACLLSLFWQQRTGPRSARRAASRRARHSSPNSSAPLPHGARSSSATWPRQRMVLR
mmetsp:Transcript_16375/g.44150  ORF Transcript_16375/g.44150 Transcript_16375/m.44150 type:complete len:208 (+) Transcript_16375:145-768(+)